MSVDNKAMQVGYQFPPVSKKITEDMLCSYSGRYPGVYVDTIHVSREAARGWGFKDLVLQGSQTMNFGTEMLFKIYREHWINNSKLTVKFIKPVLNDETVTAKGEVIARKETDDGKIRLTINVWAENSTGDKIMVGEAEVSV
jgi:acyl dehydratase